MKPFASLLILLTSLLISSSLSNSIFAQKAKPGQALTALEKYINIPDPTYKYELRKTVKEKGFTTYILYMEPQKWLTEKEVKDPVWWHWITVVVTPDILPYPPYKNK